MTLQDKLDLKRIINAAGKMTALGGSAVSPEVAAAVAEAAQGHIEMETLMIKAGEYIARILGAEAAVPTSGAAAGIAISVAATIAGDNLAKVQRLPESSGRNQIVLMKGHAINFGAPVVSMIRLGGGVPVEAGSVNHCSRGQIEEMITENTAALIYVKSHHAVQKGMESLEGCIGVAQRRGVPLIVDAAAEEDLSVYPRMGIDLTCFSGSKAILGPTSGFIVGKRDLVRACLFQYHGIGRPMKVGKESIAGLIVALERYGGVTPEKAAALKEKATYVADELKGLPGVDVSLAKDEAGREIWRTEIRIRPESAGMTATEVAQALEQGNPTIYTRNHYLNVGTILVDPRPIADGDEKVIVRRLREILLQRESSSKHKGS